MIQTTIIVYTCLILFMLLCNYINLHYVVTANNGINEKRISLFNPSFILPLFAIAIVMGMRYDVGTDHLNYIDNYLFGYEWEQKEILFVVINNICALNKIPYPVFFGIITFIQAALYYYAFRKEPQLLFWLTLFLFFDGQIGNWNNIIRVSIACSIWIYSIDFIAEKKFIPYLLLNILAIGFHTSSIILIIAYPLLYNGKNYFSSRKVQYGLFILAFIFRFTFNRFKDVINWFVTAYVYYFNDYENYNDIQYLTQSESNGSGTSIAFYSIIFINILIIGYSSKLHAYFNSSKFNIIYNIFFVGILTTYVFPEGMIILTRPFRYLYMFRPIMLSYFALYLFEKKRNDNNLFILFITMTLYVGIFYGSIIRSTPENHSLYQIYSQHPEKPVIPIYEPRSILKN